IERAHSHEAQGIARTGVVAPERDVAIWTAGDPLALAARARRHHEHRTALEEPHALGLDDGVERKGGAALALAPPAVTAVHDQRPGRARDGACRGLRALLGETTLHERLALGAHQSLRLRIRTAGRHLFLLAVRLRSLSEGGLPGKERERRAGHHEPRRTSHDKLLLREGG